MNPIRTNESPEPGRLTNGSDENSLLHASGINERSIAQGIFAIPERAAVQSEQLQERQIGLLSRLFVERGLTRVLRDARVQGVKDFAEYQRRAFRLATDTKLEMCHSMCLALSRELKVGNQERFTAMILDKHENLRRTVESKREAFLADMDGAYATSERYAHRPWLMDRAVNSLQHEVEQFFEWVDSLLEDFMAISKQRLDEYRKAESARTRPDGESGVWRI